MIQARAWPVRVMYILIAAALAIGLFITAAPAQKVTGANGDVAAEWTRVETPTTDGWVLAPESTIIDYALASAGEVAYAVVYAYDEELTSEPYPWDYYRLLKSDDGAATWTDLTDKLVDLAEEELFNDTDGSDYIDELLLVATDWEDPDFVAVAVWWYEDDTSPYYFLNVFFSTDAGETFIDAGEVEDGGIYFDDPDEVSDLVVSLEVDGERDIAIGGMDYNGYSALFRCTVTGDSAGAWEDATLYDGWDDDADLMGLGMVSYLVTDLIFSPSWETDRTILAVTTCPYGGGGPGGYYYGAIHLQSGVWGETSAAWNEDAGYAPAALIIEDVYIPYFLMYADGRGIAGVTLPEDYSGADTDTRVCWVWVNFYTDTATPTTPVGSFGEIFRVRDDAVDAVDTQIMDMPWLTNVSYLGTIAEGKAIAGVLADSDDEALDPGDLIKECCEGVQVYRNAGITNMEICCLEWDKACKPPTGRTSMAVSYVSEDKAYAVALQGDDGFIGADYDEGAWSVSFDDGDTWNQLSLIDTWIDYLSDVEVSPDCNKMFLVSINDNDGDCECDSVWVYADEFPEAGYSEYSGHWLRTWCGSLTGWTWEESEGGFLRLAPEETTGDTVYLVDAGTDTVYYNDLETLACWDRGTATVDQIMDLAVADEATIYALDYDGDVAMSDDHGKTLTWTDPVDSELETYGWSIAVHTNNATHVLVGGAYDGEVSYCDDFLAEEPEFTLLEETTDIEGHTTVAFDTYFDENDVIYAAIEGWMHNFMGSYDASQGGIYSWVIGESEDWTDLGADNAYAYTGIVLSFDATGNPFTSPETGGVLYASYVYWNDYYGEDGTGVARSLTPIVEEALCESCPSEWDYLTESDPEDWFYGSESIGFEATPDALKMCGCLDASSNTKLFAIDSWWDYDMVDHEDGAVWTFEDCYAKKQVELTSPVDGFVVPTSACDCCNVPFTIKWERVCDACCYDIEFAYDAEFAELFYPISTMPIVGEVTLDGFDFSHYCPGSELSPAAAANPSAFLGCYFQPETTYYWRVRTVEAGTGQQIHSWWSEPLSFTVSPTSAAGAIELVAPVPGALNVPPKNLGFSWHMLATADTFDWRLSKNADLSSPVDSKTGLTATACTYTGTLDYGTTYYWQVTAYKEGAAISTSAVGTFTTAPTGAFCCPVDGLCFATQAELVAHNDAEHAQPATPYWVWVVIAIGAVLVIVVIVLIFRTRRV
jgi:hypothetical protein